MDNALTTAKPIPLVPASPGIAARLLALPPRVQMIAGAGLVGLLAVLAMMFSAASSADYRMLFPNLSDKDGGQIVEKLTQLNVPYKFAEGGGTILVPSGRVHELRMKLAAAGLPSAGGGGGAAGGAGYELLDKNSFGQTQGQERMKMQRAIEGELTTTIQSLESVKTARVHLALPPQNGFFREQQKPSASVVLTLHPGRTLERSQIAGIVRVVSGSVPEMASKAVSVVDSTGALLSGPNEADGGAGLDSQQLQFRREVEASHLKRVMALLEPVIGSDNLRASVSAEIDFAQVEQQAESFRPNQGADAKPAVRELRSEESTQGSSNAGAGGTPGAVANQPPAEATAPINGPAQGLQGAGGNASSNLRRENATRFEVDKTVTWTKNAVGTVRRLSAAVVVNHRSGTDAKGKPISTPLSDKEIEQLTALVQQGIGFNAERGDLVKVVNAPFRVETAPVVDEVPLWKQPWVLELLKSAAAPLALALVALIMIFKLIRPALVAALAPPPPPAPPEPGSSLNETVDGAGAAGASGAGAGSHTLAGPEVRVALPPPDTRRIDAARTMARENPVAVANIVRGWVSGEAS